MTILTVAASKPKIDDYLTPDEVDVIVDWVYGKFNERVGEGGTSRQCLELERIWDKLPRQTCIKNKVYRGIILAADQARRLVLQRSINSKRRSKCSSWSTMPDVALMFADSKQPLEDLVGVLVGMGPVAARERCLLNVAGLAELDWDDVGIIRPNELRAESEVILRDDGRIKAVSLVAMLFDRGYDRKDKHLVDTINNQLAARSMRRLEGMYDSVLFKQGKAVSVTTRKALKTLAAGEGIGT